MATLPTGYFVTHKLMLERACYFPAPPLLSESPEGAEREIVFLLKNMTPVELIKAPG